MLLFATWKLLEGSGSFLERRIRLDPADEPLRSSSCLAAPLFGHFSYLAELLGVWDDPAAFAGMSQSGPHRHEAL